MFLIFFIIIKSIENGEEKKIERSKKIQEVTNVEELKKFIMNKKNKN